MEVAKQAKTAPIVELKYHPVYCPIHNCGGIIGASTMLAHYVEHHHKDKQIDIREIFNGQRSVILFSHYSLKFRENTSLGLLMYGAEGNIRTLQPAERGICTRNTFLYKEYVHFENHMPIILMACKTSLSAFLRNKQLERTMICPDDESKHVLVLWLASMQTTKQLYVTITVHDNLMTNSRSAIIKVRDLKLSQNPSDFLLTDPNYLLLSQGDMNMITADQRGHMLLEIILHEYNN